MENNEKKIKNYEIVPGYTYPQLQERVLKAIEEGWQPIGGVCVYPIGVEPTQGTFWQAMVK